MQRQPGGRRGFALGLLLQFMGKRGHCHGPACKARRGAPLDSRCGLYFYIFPFGIPVTRLMLQRGHSVQMHF
jgi:hypothetical protein